MDRDESNREEYEAPELRELGAVGDLTLDGASPIDLSGSPG
jgi:hypothetical protein